MKRIGLLGGMSWESTVSYYRLINDGIKARLGGLHSAELLLYSVDFQPIEACLREGRWDEIGRALAAAASSLEGAGAELLVLCTNTMHKVVPAIEEAVSIPLLHIVDATAAAIRETGLAKVGLLGTRFTMEQEFYGGRLRDRHGLEAIVPEADDRAEVDRVIFEELCQGRCVPASRAAYLEVIERLVGRGAQGIALGCTEISMLVGPEDVAMPLFDTTRLHAEAAVAYALGEAAGLRIDETDPAVPLLSSGS